MPAKYIIYCKCMESLVKSQLKIYIATSIENNNHEEKNKIIAFINVIRKKKISWNLLFVKVLILLCWLLLILRYIYLMMGSQSTNEDNLVKSLLFDRRKLVYCTNVFHLMTISLTHRKVFPLKFLLLHQILHCTFSNLFIKFSLSSLSYKISSQTRWGTTQNIKFSIKDFFSKCGQIRNFLRIYRK